MHSSLVAYLSLNLTSSLCVCTTGEQAVGNGVLPPNKAVDLLPIAFAFGVGILVQAYSFGHVSGGHFNPGKVKPCVPTFSNGQGTGRTDGEVGPVRMSINSHFLLLLCQFSPSRHALPFLVGRM